MTSLMLQEQTRSLAAALAGIKREDVDRQLSMSPPMSANNSATALYPGLQQAAAASAFGMLSPTQLLAANRQAAAAFMAAQLQPTMSTLASTLFPHHPALFGSWAAAANTQQHHHMAQLGGAPHSPPASPNSPIGNNSTSSSSSMHLGKHNLGLISPNSQEVPLKKGRKSGGIKKEVSSAIDISLTVRSDIYHTPSGPMSPPSSGSSPTNSTHDGPTLAVSAVRDPSRDKSFTCKTCNRSFGYKHVLQNHERTHTGEKPFECPECHKRFTRDHHLKTHMRLHTGEKPYDCPHCDRRFVQVANLRRHLRVHTGEKPYTCEICDGKFSDSNQLKSHMLVHNGEKPFECERCHAKFRRRHHFLNHKCGIQSPPTPAVSPAMSGDFPMCDQKSTMCSSYGSEESMDLGVGKPTTHHIKYDGLEHTEAPLDLSEEAANFDSKISLRKAQHDMQQIFRLPPPQMMRLQNEMPEQTEPEDLSMHSQHKNRPTSTEPMVTGMLHDDLDLDELDDAASYYMRHQHQLAAQLKHCVNISTGKMQE